MNQTDRFGSFSINLFGSHDGVLRFPKLWGLCRWRPGSVVTWGNHHAGGDSSEVQEKLRSLGEAGEAALAAAKQRKTTQLWVCFLALLETHVLHVRAGARPPRVVRSPLRLCVGRLTPKDQCWTSMLPKRPSLPSSLMDEW